jgi:catechol 2,3-dioxygenase-like lactoylglutathione lyase family enzyme
MLTLDHVVIGVEDLDAASRALGATLGRRPSWRGRHPSYGTANVLFRLDNAYLELLAPDPEATTDTAWTGSLGRFLKERGGGLFSIALQTPDVVSETARARAQGLPVEDPLPGSGVDLDSGATREWVNARIPPESTRGTRCFFIEHRTPADALPPAALDVDGSAAVSSVVAVIASSAEPAGARVMWRGSFGLSETAAASGWRFELGNATLFLQAGGAKASPEAPPDRWEAIVLAVPDLTRARARLAPDGIGTSPETIAGYAGLAATVCGARHLFVEGK